MKSRVAAFAAVCVSLSPGFSAAAAPSAPDEVQVAIARLEIEKNYSWQTRFAGGVIVEGRTQSGGYAVIQANSPGPLRSVVSHAQRRVAETPYGWLSPRQLREKHTPDNTRTWCTPLQQLQDMAEDCGGFTISGGTATGAFSQDEAEKLWQAYAALIGGPSARGSRVYETSSAWYGPPSGRVEISISDGIVTGYQLHLERPVSNCFGRSTLHWIISTTIHSIGSTTVVVPPEAKTALDELDKS